ncbi:hypothetical protein BD769DRAFT_171517 [Suillus cothurnatus]|nr:hypothetical protein BD769DRAFT_171517 [Suillus cothurnatus]
MSILILMSRLTAENLLRRFVVSAVYNGLGIHRNIKEFAPAAIPVVPDVKQTGRVFGAGGVLPSSVDLVALSHLHWDHLGDPSPFATAEFVFREGSKQAF